MIRQVAAVYDLISACRRDYSVIAKPPGFFTARPHSSMNVVRHINIAFQSVHLSVTLSIVQKRLYLSNFFHRRVLAIG